MTYRRLVSAFAALALAPAPLVACSNLTAPPSADPTPPPEQTAARPAPSNKPDMPAGLASAVARAKVAEELKIDDVVVGTGEAVKLGDTVSVHYVGTFTDGKEFDSSRRRGVPFDFTVGRSQVIQGWEKGLVGMKVGGKRKLRIPPSLGYGTQDVRGIPGNSTLLFDLELVGIKNAR